MSTQLVTLDIHPVAYTLAVYKGARCLCISSRPEPNKLMLVYLPLSQVNLNTFKSGYTLPEIYIVATLLSLFKHIPYTPVGITGRMIMVNTPRVVTYFISQLDEWQNGDPKLINSNITTMFFDIEVDGSDSIFPTPEKNKVTCISMKLGEAPTMVLTTFPVDQLRAYHQRKGIDYELKEYVQYNDEFIMITYFLDQCLKADRAIQYNGNSFDWPFLLRILQKYTLGTRFWSDLSQQEGRGIVLDTAFFPTPFGMKERLILVVPGLEHVDLLYVCKRLFPFWPNHKLDTAGKELTKAGKFGFEMKDYFRLIQDIAESRSRNEALTPRSLELLSQALIYSKVDCDVLVAIYEALATYRNLAREFCYLCAQDWSESTEAVGLLLRFNPYITEVAATTPKLNLKVGLYKDAGVCVVRKFILQACKNQALKDFLATSTSSLGFRAIDFFQLLAQLYDYTDYIDQDKYNKTIENYFSGSDTTYIGSFGAYTYVTTTGIDVIYTHSVLAVPAAASWLSLDMQEEKKVSLDTKGKARICQAMPAVIEALITRELVAMAQGTSDMRLSKYIKNKTVLTEKLFPEGTVPIMAEFVEKTNVTTANYVTYEALLREEEKQYLLNRGDFVTIESVEGEGGTVRVFSPYSQVIALNHNYYVDMLIGHLTTLNKIMGVKTKG